MRQPITNLSEHYPDHHFRTETPNIIFEIGLSALQQIVYIHLKKIAGDTGYCWKSCSNLAKEIGLSERFLRQTIRSLSNPFPMLGNLPLIKITPTKKSDGSNSTNTIEIIPIWRLNGEFFRKKGGGACGAGGVGHVVPGGGACGADKEDPLEEDPFKETTTQPKKKPQTATPVTPAAVVVFPSLDKVELTQTLKRKISKEYSQVEVDLAVDRCLKWKSRKSDATAIMFVLKNSQEWQVGDFLR